MTKEQLHHLKNQFENYTESFLEDEKNRSNFLLKIHHTHRVCDAIVQIGMSLNLNDSDLNLAGAIALFHDIGRFRQLKQYATFADLKSEDHAHLGVRVLNEQNLLGGIDIEESTILLKAVEVHNKFSLPEHENERNLLFMKLVRDADKLDIYKVVADEYQSKDAQINPSIFWDLPDIDEISDEVVDDLRSKKMVLNKHVQTHVDFKMLQMGWVYGINFKATCQRLKALNYLELIYHTLPKLPVITELYQQITDDLNVRCKQ